MRRTLLLILVSAGLLIPAALFAGGKAESTGASVVAKPTEADPAFGKLPQLVTVTSGTRQLGREKDLPAGQTLEDNEYTRYYKDQLNVQLKLNFAVADFDPYNEKTKLLVASNDIPDFLLLYKEEIFRLAQRSGLLEDLTGWYENYASPLVKNFYDTAPNQISIKAGSIGGKLWALTNNLPSDAMYTLLWVRQDWLDKLGMKPPKTLDDVIAIATAFRDKDPGGNGPGKTIGLGGNPYLAGLGSEMLMFGPIFSLYDAYVKLWYRDSSGKVVYGSVQPEVKAGLAKLRQMYADKVIDPEFAVRKDYTEVLSSNICGIHFSTWWAPLWPLDSSYTNSGEKANWQPYIAPVNAAGKVNHATSEPGDAWLVVKKGIPHPEAIIKMYNLFTRLENSLDPMTGKFYGGDPNLSGFEGNRQFGPNLPYLNYADADQRTLANIQKVQKGTMAADMLAGPDKALYDNVVKFQAGDHSTAVWKQYTSFYLANTLFDNPLWSHKQGEFFGITQTMETKWDSLQKLEQESMLQIIMGEKDLSYFDTFVSQWKALGGDQITAEVNTIVGPKK
jgi:putative aldouronate transport system substrate-binding protein